MAIGDGHVRPAANQLSVSATQKSESLCVMMAWVSVMTTSPSVENSLSCLVRCTISSRLSFGLSGALSIASSKFISVNIGMLASVSGAGMSMSKSAGRGRVSATISVVLVTPAVVVGCGALNTDVWTRPMLLRARIKANRNSAGMSSGSSAGASTSSGPSVGVSVSGTGAGSDAGAGAGFKNAGILIFGNGIVIRGFLVRTINVVVAM